jgi:hypothetical protein
VFIRALDRTSHTIDEKSYLEKRKPIKTLKKAIKQKLCCGRPDPARVCTKELHKKFKM